MARAAEALSQVNQLADDALRYGQLWRRFSVSELLSYAQYKLKRSDLLASHGMMRESTDDLVDALNHLRFAIDNTIRREEEDE